MSCMLGFQGGRPSSGQPAQDEEAVTGRSRYSAPVTTGQDKGPDGVDRIGTAPSQVHHSPVLPHHFFVSLSCLSSVKIAVQVIGRIRFAGQVLCG